MQKAPLMSGIVTTLLHQYGALGVMAGAALEGEAAVVTGGILAHQGLFSPWLAALGAWAGSFGADQLFFALSRSQRQSRFVARVRARPAFGRAMRFLEDHPVTFCIVFRFIYGFRIAGPIAVGASGVSARLFLILNCVSAAIWGAVFTFVGYRFSVPFEHILRMIADFARHPFGE